MPEISIQGGAAEEGEYLPFTITLSESVQYPVSFSYRTLLNGTATDADLVYGSDYWDGTARFDPGETTLSIRVRSNDDKNPESDEGYILELFNTSTNANFANDEPLIRAMGIIRDNDGGAGLAILTSDPVLVEGNSGIKNAVFEVRLSRPAESAISVSFQTIDGTAVAGQDYQATSGTLTFAPGQEVLTVSVPVVGDTLEEMAETFSLKVTPPADSGISILGATGVATILDTDTSRLPEISISGASAIEGEYMQFTVTLSEPSAAQVTLDYRTLLNGSAADSDLVYGADYWDGRIRFDPGKTSASIFVRSNDDTISEKDESFSILLSNPTGAVFAEGRTNLEATGFILDAYGVEGISAATTNVLALEPKEGTSIQEFLVRLSQPVDAEVTFGVSASGLTATPGADFTLLDQSVTFAPGQTEASVAVRIVGDGAVEPNETFTINLLPQSGVSGIIPSTTVSIIDATLAVEQGTVRNDIFAATADVDIYNGGPGFDRVAYTERSVGVERLDDGSFRVQATGYSNTLIDIERIDLSGGAYYRLDVDANDVAATIYRLYQAGFARTPDQGGLEFWIGQRDAGLSTRQIADYFLSSSEAQAAYGGTSNEAFVAALYFNVLGRQGEQGGINFWRGALDSGAATRTSILDDFADSSENIQAVGAVIEDGIYFA
ncbi:Calx-beta domain-containing protein [Fulvimarina manganoxydans]|uniref:Calx-beta domain-containing protein n=1 Tax=Fulvimarina manganoxydans TaxID=937218 RepID=A0A1W2EWQ1_9HYPH|nr:Calx-beta domain-containing protein [Fulvimarina manganoxydans]SMD13648.1 Calx-beta domain-containing protein [Fulvimarina manganoxydans]